LLHAGARPRLLHAEASTPTLVDRLNRTLADYPTSSSVAHVAGSIGTFGAAFGFWFYVVGLDFPALAVGGIVSRLVKRPRLPLDLAMAASLAHAAPGMNKLKLGPLLTPFLDQRPGTAAPPETDGLSGRLMALLRSVEGPVNTYGGPFLLCTWANGLATVAGATLMTQYGVDVASAVDAAFSWVPFSGSGDGSAQALLTTSASAAAAAKCTNSLTMPLRLVLLAHYGGPAMVALEKFRAELTRKERAMLKGMLRERPDHPGRLKKRGAQGDDADPPRDH